MITFTTRHLPTIIILTIFQLITIIYGLWGSTNIRFRIPIGTSNTTITQDWVQPTCLTIFCIILTAIAILRCNRTPRRPRHTYNASHTQGHKKSNRKFHLDSILSGKIIPPPTPPTQAQKKKHPFNNNLKIFFKLSHILT